MNRLVAELPKENVLIFIVFILSFIAFLDDTLGVVPNNACPSHFNSSTLVLW